MSDTEKKNCATPEAERSPAPAAVAVLLIILTVLFILNSAAGCAGEKGTDIETEWEDTAVETSPAVTVSPGTAQKIREMKYKGPYSKETGCLVGTDALGRVLPTDITPPARDDGEREVGIFYFLWLGQHGKAAVYDNSVIEKVPGSTGSEAAWIAAGGGGVGETHFWGKPLFGYYTTDDTWVMRKHVQMLADAGIDYLVIDATNGYTYSAQALRLMSMLKKYHDDGFDVPKIAFYTNSSSGRTINAVYNEIYKAHPEYSDIWYMWEGRPMIVGSSSDPEISDEARAFFRIKESQWPTEGKKEDGFPWMEFGRLLSDAAVYDGGKFVNISVAQHSSTVTMSATAFYGANDRTRSWHDGSNDRSPGAVLHGYNFAEQWEWALSRNVKNIFVTGWNEWGAQRQPATLNPKYPIYFVDCCDPDTSRDIEPMDGLFGDNYYMQLAGGIRRFKGTPPRVDIGGYASVDTGSPDAALEAFDGATAVYRDYSSDDGDRNAQGFGGISYKNATGLNDITVTKVLRDRDYLWFYAEVRGSKVMFEPEGRMTLLICPNSGNTPVFGSGGGDVAGKVAGFSFAVNRKKAEGGTMSLEKAAAGGSGWEDAGAVEYISSGRSLAVKIPRGILGLDGTDDPENDLISLSFKWTDGCDTTDVMSFYRDGDAAPYGRMSYLYSNIK
ncbi:MAG: hypothetical protein II534_03305 [Clostridia bacterium]|nr:hypothetical protein [Clostridia bacterium]